jgi:SOS-response transcriptional repressor LexA
MPLTKCQHKVLQFIRKFIAKNEYSPSYEEIGIGLRLSSLSTIARHVLHLKELGYIDFKYKSSRSIILK